MSAKSIIPNPVGGAALDPAASALPAGTMCSSGSAGRGRC